MTRYALWLLVLAVACKEAPVNPSRDAGQSSLAGKWQGVSSVAPNGQGALARMELENAPGGQVRGVLNVSFDMDASDLGTIGVVAGPAQGGTFARGPPLPRRGVADQVPDDRYRVPIAQPHRYRRAGADPRRRPATHLLPDGQVVAFALLFELVWQPAAPQMLGAWLQQSVRSGVK